VNHYDHRAVPLFNRACVPNNNGAWINGGELCHGGTTGYFVLKGTDRYLLTANHLWNSCADTDGIEVYQHDTYIGEIAGHHQAHDWAIIEDNAVETEFARDPWIWAGDGTSARQVGSWVTEYGLSYFKSKNRKCYQYGVSSGETLGYITGTHVSSEAGHKACTAHNEAVELNTNFARGDSGGPMYIYEHDGDGQVSIIGHGTYGFTHIWEWPPSAACNGNKTWANCGGHPGWKVQKEDYGGQYNIHTWNI
jgi:hypothetical protein